MWQALLIKVENNLSNIIATSVGEGTAAIPQTSFKGQRWVARICTHIHVGSRRKGKHWQDHAVGTSGLREQASTI